MREMFMFAPSGYYTKEIWWLVSDMRTELLSQLNRLTSETINQKFHTNFRENFKAFFAIYFTKYIHVMNYSKF